ncbi:hypothetical protein LZ30DRAFT_805922, partial [Colletotrichum cereale]
KIIYFGRCIHWIVVDALLNLFLHYKIQEAKQPPAAQQWECTKFISLIHFLVEIPLIILLYPLCKLVGLNIQIPFLTWDAMAT